METIKQKEKNDTNPTLQLQVCKNFTITNYEQNPLNVIADGCGPDGGDRVAGVGRGREELPARTNNLLVDPGS